MPYLSRNRCAHAALALVTLSLAAGAAHAIVLPFYEPYFDWYAPAVPETFQYDIWTAGDHWGQNYPGTGLLFATQLDLNLQIGSYCNQDLNLNVLVNNNSVGTLTLHPGDGGRLSHTFTFPPILGDDYSIYMVAQNTVDPLGYDLFITNALNGHPSSATLTTPEPGALALLLPGALVLTRRRRV